MVLDIALISWIIGILIGIVISVYEVAKGFSNPALSNKIKVMLFTFVEPYKSYDEYHTTFCIRSIVIGLGSLIPLFMDYVLVFALLLAIWLADGLLLLFRREVIQHLEE